MKKIKSFCIKYKFQLFSLLVAFTILLFTSKNSFLYPFNDWVDANAFFTVGKSMMNGVVPYRDLFEQKGLLLYLIYGIGYLLSNNTFYGVFILEIISFTIFLYYSHKIFSMYLDEKYSFILLPILSFIITTSYSFAQGGSCEEFCLPFFGISLYYFIKHFKDRELTDKEIYINGLMAGLVLLMKYTMLGFWIGFVLFIFIDLLKKKKTKIAFMFCVKFLVGMFIPFAIALLYLLFTGGIKAFFEDYFIINMTAYQSGQKYNIIQRIYRIGRASFIAIRQNGKALIIAIASMPVLVWFIKDKNKYFKMCLIGLMLFSLFFIYWGLRLFRYYLLPVSIFTIISMIGCVSLIKKYSDRFINKKYMYFVFSFIFVISALFSFMKAQFRDDLLKSRNEYFQYKYADYINKYENPTLLNMGFLDVGVYTVGKIIPNTKHFEKQNISYENYPDNIDSLNNSAANKETMFIVYIASDESTKIPNVVTDNYDLVYKDKYEYEQSTFFAYLYQLKELS